MSVVELWVFLEVLKLCLQLQASLSVHVCSEHAFLVSFELQWVEYELV